MKKSSLYVLVILLMSILGFTSCHPEFEPICVDPYYMGHLDISDKSKSMIPYTVQPKKYIYNYYCNKDHFFQLEPFLQINTERGGWLKFLKCHLDTSVVVENAYYYERKYEVTMNFPGLTLKICYHRDICYNFFDNTTSLDTRWIDRISIYDATNSFCYSNDDYFTDFNGESGCSYQNRFSNNFREEVTLGEFTYNNVTRINSRIDNVEYDI